MCLHIQESHKSTRLISIVYMTENMLKIHVDSNCCLHLCVLKWALLFFFFFFKEGLALLESSVISLVTTPSAFSFHGFHLALRRYLMEVIHLEMFVPRSLTLQNIWLWVSLFVPISFRIKALWRWLKKATIYEWNRIY